jgi:hypothetical protein
MLCNQLNFYLQENLNHDVIIKVYISSLFNEDIDRFTNNPFVIPPCLWEHLRSSCTFAILVLINLSISDSVHQQHNKARLPPNVIQRIWLLCFRSATNLVIHCSQEPAS